ncbi:putative receptor-like protein kinase At3g47110 [Hordeum vulgare subsp. vulgare]|uniref:Receptor kinase-like protein Xa21 n=1 Tax=Hordeum vulgare subsp. vulgare TaxID=112509 RepID=M0X2D2_HORVV|nr:putative receptor-like protein kinase At3g47110 [Hordeum vulgare subsp. vulgare]XP_044963434.1 putative receptor-like protein kinase At3g47110 [Hordeum vulgare subsp. vulgare]XP_044963435.1 putative receptor-like protein kinase At3g47110 [Hordeum vulgare subsp. vulgare]XP_044963436.1 putative receptor-like protein kinase At3g47110 [Hordeum vulgare subsp. vulgare]
MAMGIMSLLCSFLAVLTTATVSGSDHDEAALLAFRAQVSDGGSLASWNSSASFCSWEGVTCSHRRPARVVALRLNNKALAGELSPAIGNLTFLRTLNLSFNWLHGEIPASLGRLRRLHRLDLGDNSFSGTLPVNLSSCVSMAIMGLLNNKLGGRIPAELGEKLTSLVRISLSNNSFTGLIPPSLANLSHLEILDLSRNQLVGSIPPRLGSIQGMQQFSIARNLINGMIPTSLYNWSSLQLFDVGTNMMYGSLDSIGNKFPKLKYLGLSGNNFTGTIPSSISNISSLLSVGFDSNRFSGYFSPAFGKLAALQYLNLNNNKLEANDNKGWEFITSLANCSQLQLLVLSSNSFQGQLPGSIVNLSTTLQYLHLGDNRISGSIPADIGNLIGLQTLAIVNTSMSGMIPKSIGKLQNLIDLALYNNSLSGLIPPSLGNLSQLNKLYARNSNLEGPIPASLGKLKNLIVLDLKMNYHLNGSIPKEIFRLPSLSWYLDLSYNSLSGPLPNEVGSLANLNLLVLSGNQLSGKIPDSIQNCMVLEQLFLDNNSFEGNIPQSLTNIRGLSILNLTMNKFSGNIPDAIGNIGNLRELYVAHNNLSGSIPLVLEKLSSLSELDISYNNLQGEVPNVGVFRNITHLAVVGNVNLCGGTPQLHLAPCPTGVLSKKRKKMPKSLVISLAAVGAIMFLLAVIVLVWRLCKKLKSSQNAVAKDSIVDGHYRRIPYPALLKGTNEFSEANLLGKGSYGAVYKCVLDNEETELAVKVFNLGRSRYSKSFEAECEAMRRIRHRCLIKIITSCSSINHQGQEFKALVFEFMPNGNLDSWLHQPSQDPTANNTLSLAQRFDIAVDIVDAVEYLHRYCQPLVIHCDIKPSNILLAEDMSARVGDFGISRILQENTSEGMQSSYGSTGIKGSIGYVAPEYGEGSAVSTAGDIYSLGILLLEMFTGRSPTEGMFRDSLDLHKFVEDALQDRTLEIADPTMWLHSGQWDNTTSIRIMELLVSVFRLGISCSRQHPRDRTTTGDAAAEMHAIRDAYLKFIGEHGAETEASTEEIQNSVA